MSEDATTFRIEGEFSIYSAAQLRLQLMQWLQAAPAGTALKLDLAQVSEIDSAGLQLLLSAMRSAASQQCEIHVCAASDTVQQVLAITELAHCLFVTTTS